MKANGAKSVKNSLDNIIEILLTKCMNSNRKSIEYSRRNCIKNQEKDVNAKKNNRNRVKK